ncbi:MAG: hypothetical protein ACI8RD_001742, partial [Bacillariaceae sp.]
PLHVHDQSSILLPHELEKEPQRIGGVVSGDGIYTERLNESLHVRLCESCRILRAPKMNECVTFSDSEIIQF